MRVDVVDRQRGLRPSPGRRRPCRGPRRSRGRVAAAGWPRAASRASGRRSRRRRPARAARSSSSAERTRIDVSSSTLVEVEVRGEPEPVAQRAGQQAGPRRGADQRERRQLERDRGGTRALADDHVDPEVLHREVEHLLGRPGHAVDLVEEEHLALGERRQHRREVAGVLDRRAAGDAQRLAELGGDDHRQRGLAEARRTGEQHVVGCGAPRRTPPTARARAARAPASARRTRRGAWDAAPRRSRRRHCWAMRVDRPVCVTGGGRAARRRSPLIGVS